MLPHLVADSGAVGGGGVGRGVTMLFLLAETDSYVNLLCARIATCLYLCICVCLCCIGEQYYTSPSLPFLV